jgi:predicted phage terminase large subunit-like protein
MADKDGPNTVVVIETVGGYKDAYEEIRRVLAGRAIVRNLTPTTDKVARATCVEPYFESGMVYVKAGPWVDAFLKQLGQFPSGQHDDWVDAVVTAVHDVIINRGTASVSG